MDNRPPPPPVPRRRPISEEDENPIPLDDHLLPLGSFTENLPRSSNSPTGAIENKKQQLQTKLITNYPSHEEMKASEMRFKEQSVNSVRSPLMDLASYEAEARLSTASAYMQYHQVAQQMGLEAHVHSRHQDVLRRMPPARPLTRLPNALPLDVAVAEESSKKKIEALKSPNNNSDTLESDSLQSPESEDIPKRPQHPSVETQLMYVLETHPDFFMDTYYKADEKLDRMLDFSVFDSRHLEAMRDSIDRQYFEECQAVCASYERYRVALTEKIQKKMEADLKEKHKRQLNHIKSFSAKTKLNEHSKVDNISLSSLDFNDD